MCVVRIMLKSFVSFRFVSFRSPSLCYLLVHSRCRGFLWFHLITPKHTPQLVGLLWTSDRPVAETSTSQHQHCTETNIHAPGGIWTQDPRKHSTGDLRLRPRGHWDWHTKRYFDFCQHSAFTYTSMLHVTLSKTAAVFINDVIFVIIVWMFQSCIIDTRIVRVKFHAHTVLTVSDIGQILSSRLLRNVSTYVSAYIAPYFMTLLFAVTPLRTSYLTEWA
jgi:hypothetical protein